MRKHEISKTIQNNYSATKSYRKPRQCWHKISYKLVIIEHRKRSHRLSKTIREAENFSQVGSGKSSNSPLYTETKKMNIFWTKKNMQK